MSGFSFITQLLNKSIEKVKDDFSKEEPTVKRKLEEISEEEIEIPVKKKKKKRVKENIESELEVPENETSPAKQKEKSKKRDLEENQIMLEPDGLSLEADLSLIKKKKKKHKKCKEEEAEIRLQEGIVSKDSDELCVEEAEDLSLIKKKKKKHNKCKKEEAEIRLQEGIVNQDSVELCVEEAEDLSSQKKKKHKKRKQEERKIRAQEGIVNNRVVSAKTQKESKDKEKNEDIENQVDKVLVENNIIPEKIHERPSTIKHRTLISDIYTPDLNIITGQLFKVVVYILKKQISVSKLNVVYTNTSYPDTKTRVYLTGKYNAIFRQYTQEEDTIILERFKILVDKKIITDAKDFLDELTAQNGNEHRSEKDKATRNILGLYLGKDFTNRIAYDTSQRVVYLLRGKSLVNNYTAKKQEYTSGPVYIMKQKKRCWTLEEDKILVEMVLRDKNGGKFLPVEQCVEAKVDWDSIGEYFTEYGRTKQLVRERWTRTVKMMLLENEQDPEEIYEYQRNLIQHVMNMGVKDRKEIRWNELAKVFDPKTSSVLSQDFWNLIRHRKNETLSGKLSAALECLENPMKQSLSANIKKNETKSQLLDFYHSLVK